MFHHAARHVRVATAPSMSLLAASMGAMRLFTSKLRPEQAQPDNDNRLLTLHNIRDNKGARKKARRFGRGPGTGRGKTAGRGQKGLYARRSLKARHYEGGSSALLKRSPKRGMRTGMHERPLDVVNCWRLALFIREGRIDPKETITLKVLKDSGVIGNSRIKHGLKLLANGKEALAGLPPLNIEVTHSSESAKDAVKAQGGSVKFVHFNRMGLRAHLFPEKFHSALLPRAAGLPKPTKASRYDTQDDNKYTNPHPRAVEAYEKRTAMKERKRAKLALKAELREKFEADIAADTEFAAQLAAAKAAKLQAKVAKYKPKTRPWSVGGEK